MALLHQIHKAQVFQRLNKEHVTQPCKVLTEHFVDGLAHIGIEVHGIDKVNLRITLREVLDGSTHVDETVAEVLAAVTGDEHQFATVGQALYTVPRTIASHQ